ncbi:MAG: hypothetical protein ABJA74_00065 [Lapillicoccus sp.]
MSVPVIVVAVDDPWVRDALVADLARRFTPDYEVVCGSSGWAIAHLESLADEGREVALVMAATDLPESGIGGVELLANVRRRHPQARRQLLVDRGQWRGHPVREAMELGQVDSCVFVPWAQRELWLYLPVSEVLADWERSQPPAQVAVTVVGQPEARAPTSCATSSAGRPSRTRSSTQTLPRVRRSSPTTVTVAQRPLCRSSS